MCKQNRGSVFIPIIIWFLYLGQLVGSIDLDAGAPHWIEQREHHPAEVDRAGELFVEIDGDGGYAYLTEAEG